MFGKHVLLITSLNELIFFAHCKKLVTLVKGYSKAPFWIATTQGVGEGATPFPGFLHFTIDSCLILLSVNQGGTKYHFLNLWYDSTWDWTPVSQTIGEQSTH